MILFWILLLWNVFHVVPVEDPTLREMAEYMEVNRYAQNWITFFVAPDYGQTSITGIQTFSLVPILKLQHWKVQSSEFVLLSGIKSSACTCCI